MMLDAFHDEEGMTTVGMVLALLVTLALVFSAGQAYRVGSASSEVQNVADAAALAAQNEVGEFMIVVRVCDAMVLSLSLTSLVATGLGVAALCTPATAAASETLLKAGRDVAHARDRFAEKAADGLNRLQRLLPFLAAANAASVAAANNGTSSNYVALAVPAPSAWRGDLRGRGRRARGRWARRSTVLPTRCVRRPTRPSAPPSGPTRRSCARSSTTAASTRPIACTSAQRRWRA